MGDNRGSQGDRHHDHQGPAEDPARGLVARVDAPMFVVTAGSGAERSGCLVGFATQCSIDPYRFLVCISTANRTYEVAREAPVLAVHLLGAGQRSLAALFGAVTGDDSDKFARCAWHPGAHGVPVLDQCAAWMEGRVVDRVSLGDHVGMVLEPLDGGPGVAHGGLAFSQVRDLSAGHPA